MLARLTPLLRRVGITRVGNVTGLDHIGFPVWMAVRPLSLSLSVSQGKGETDDAAKVSAIMECLEAFHTENIVCDRHVRCLSEAHGLPEYLDIFNLAVRSSARIKPETLIEWVNGLELTSGSNVYVPRALVELDFYGDWTAQRIFQMNSIGLAGGASLDEAVLHGLCEVIENDQVSLWMAGMSHSVLGRNRRVSIESINDERCTRLIERVLSSGLRMGIWYATCDLLMPCFACIIYDDRPEALYPQRASGFGAHPSKGTALYRAVAEALQGRVTFISGARDDFYADRYAAVRTDVQGAVQWKSAVCDTALSTDYAEIAEYGEFRDARNLQGQILKDLGRAECTQIIVVDLSRPEIGIPFVKVIVPGTELDVRNALYAPGERMKRLLSGKD